METAEYPTMTWCPNFALLKWREIHFSYPTMTLRLKIQIGKVGRRFPLLPCGSPACGHRSLLPRDKQGKKTAQSQSRDSVLEMTAVIGCRQWECGIWNRGAPMSAECVISSINTAKAFFKKIKNQNAARIFRVHQISQAPAGMGLPRTRLPWQTCLRIKCRTARGIEIHAIRPTPRSS